MVAAKQGEDRLPHQQAFGRDNGVSFSVAIPLANGVSFGRASAENDGQHGIADADTHAGRFFRACFGFVNLEAKTQVAAVVAAVIFQLQGIGVLEQVYGALPLIGHFVGEFFGIFFGINCRGQQKPGQ